MSTVPAKEKNLLPLFYIALIVFCASLLRSIFLMATPQKMFWISSGFIQTYRMHDLLGWLALYSLRYALLAFLFLSLHRRIRGSQLFKAMQFILWCFSLFLVYIVEPMPGNSIGKILLMIFYEALPLSFLGGTLSLLVGRPSKRLKKVPLEKVLPGAFCTALCFFLGRLMLYHFAETLSVYETQRSWILFWAVIAGFVIGAVGERVRPILAGEDQLIQALLYGLLFFGLAVAGFKLTQTLRTEIEWLEVLFRTLTDVLCTTAGAFLSARLYGLKQGQVHLTKERGV